MTTRRLSRGLFLSTFLAAVVMTGCATRQAVPQPAPPPPPPPDADTPSAQCAPWQEKFSSSVFIDAKNTASIDKTFRKDHEVEVCKGKQVIVWYAEGGKDLKIVIEQGKSIPSGKKRGTFDGSIDCGNVYKPGVADPVASTCVATVKVESVSGNVAYTLIVTPGATPTTPYKVDPQMIIQP
jgi:hypothetical protein